MQDVENVKNENAKVTLPKSTQDNGHGTQQIENTKPLSRRLVVPKDSLIVVSQQQFETVRQAHTDSINLLDSCGNALLDAMQMAIPPKDSGRTVGEYTGQNLRQMAKSVCDIVQTKTGVVRSIYQISRDEC